MSSGATLRMLDRADKEVMKLSRAEIGAVYEFMHKFRHNPANPGLHLKPLGGTPVTVKSCRCPIG